MYRKKRIWQLKCSCYNTYMKLVSKSIIETKNIAHDLVRALASARLSGRATVLALAGDLGAGKTALTKAIAHELGVAEDVTSPTFVLEKIYRLPKKMPFEHLVHIDAYRLEGVHELEAIGWDEALAHHGNLIVIEWPERVDQAIPHTAHTVRLRAVNETTREIIIPKSLVPLWPEPKTKKN